VDLLFLSEFIGCDSLKKSIQFHVLDVFRNFFSCVALTIKATQCLILAVI